MDLHRGTEPADEVDTPEQFAELLRQERGVGVEDCRAFGPLGRARQIRGANHPECVLRRCRRPERFDGAVAHPEDAAHPARIELPQDVVGDRSAPSERFQGCERGNELDTAGGFRNDADDLFDLGPVCRRLGAGEDDKRLASGRRSGIDENNRPGREFRGERGVAVHRRELDCRGDDDCSVEIRGLDGLQVLCHEGVVRPGELFSGERLGQEHVPAVGWIDAGDAVLG